MLKLGPEIPAYRSLLLPEPQGGTLIPSAHVTSTSPEQTDGEIWREVILCNRLGSIGGFVVSVGIVSSTIRDKLHNAPLAAGDRPVALRPLLSLLRQRDAASKPDVISPS
jgi:hypothetical protein